jgi:hypothetical protein
MKLITIPNEHDKKHKYKKISLAWVEDKNLSWKAKGILCYLISRPPHWRLFTEDIKQKSSNGTTYMRSGIKELIDKKYMYRIIKRKNNKQISYWGFLVTESPMEIKVVMKYLIKNNKGWEVYLTKNDKKATLLKPVSIIYSNSNYNTITDTTIKDKSFIHSIGIAASHEAELLSTTKFFTGVLKQRNKKPIINEQIYLTSKQTQIPLLKNIDKSSLPNKAESFISETSAYRKECIEQTNLYTKQVNAEMRLTKRLKLQKKVEAPLLLIPDNVKELFDIWEGEGFRLCTENNTRKNNLIKMCKRLLNGELKEVPGLCPFPGISKIEGSIKRYRLAAFEMEFMPPDEKVKKTMQKKGFDEFIFSKNASYDKSKLLKYMDEKLPYLNKLYVGKPADDLAPITSKKIKAFYYRKAMGGYPLKCNAKEEDCFRKAANMIKAFVDKNQMTGAFESYLDSSYPTIAEHLCQAIWKNCGEQPTRLYPRSFCSDNAVSILVKKLHEEGLINDRIRLVDENNKIIPKPKPKATEYGRCVLQEDLDLMAHGGTLCK